jgi:ParB family transcriptional regulator, chromosome partitioning protein
MIDAGLSVTKVAKKLSVGKDTVKAAQTAATSSVALEALEGGQISLSETAVLTEFEHDGAEPLDRLVAAAGTPRFDHVVAQLRAERASAQAYAQAVADYTERGFTILDDDARWGWRLDRVPLRHLQRDGDDGEPDALDESVITDPQHWAVRLEEYTEYVDADGNVIDEGDIDWDTEGEPDAEPEEGLRHADSVVERTAFAPEWFCLNPEAAGVRISESYQRNAEYFARDRSTQSRTDTGDLDNDASDADRQAARARAETNKPRPKSASGALWSTSTNSMPPPPACAASSSPPCWPARPFPKARHHSSRTAWHATATCSPNTTATKSPPSCSASTRPRCTRRSATCPQAATTVPW